MIVQVLTHDVCLEDMPHMPHVMSALATSIDRAIQFLMKNGAENITTQWRVIDDRDCAVDGTIGFFIVSGNITKGK